MGPLAALKVLELGQLVAGAVRDGFLGVVWGGSNQVEPPGQETRCGRGG